MTYVNGKQYVTLGEPVIMEPQVLRLFSFYCPNSNLFEMNRIPAAISKAVPAGPSRPSITRISWVPWQSS
ncbi:MAG: dsbA [Nocardia sp.]|uniref:hypothetical protein n=1 Tax=Nocardia sp. TaxID=1821 RepID=UPI00262DE622|nr:hypothetical protein [Nocardia sp.]MCU1646182.1 dsbA [Nocardia sp.]